jgi:UDP-GlcNAc:undecaprenyl-phosphate GlcNAc-1-phosphate transferase
MNNVIANPIALMIVSLVVTIILTLAVRAFARRFDFVAKPKADRWHKKPTAMLGGAAIFLSTVSVYIAFAPKTFESLTVITAAAFLFFIGLVDDVINIKPYQKLIGQLFGAVFVVGFGLKLPLTGFELIDIWITIFWIIGITNAINLLDNMDGLAAGISAIAAISLGLSFWVNGQPSETLVISIFVGSLLGFLIFNFNPASIFMGDCGSMFVGFLLSTSVLLGQIGGRSRSVMTILAVPVLILFVPIFDTTFVTVLRKLWGRKASQGGRDHTSHRLVALGLSERNAVLMLYGFAICAGLLSLAISQLELTQSLALIGVFTVILVIIGVYLSNVKVYEDREVDLAVRDRAVFTFLINVSYKRRVFEVFLDAFLITISYYISYALLFGTFEQSSNWSLFVSTLPLLIVLKLAAFLLVGVYRGIWRYTSIGDFITFAKGVILGSGLCVLAILLLYRFQNFSRAVFVVDSLILLLTLVGSRMAFRLIRQVLPMPGSSDGKRVLIYGAGDGGEMVYRELRNNPEWQYIPVGFLDDDPLKQDKVIHGLRVFDANGTFPDVCASQEVEEVLISFRDVSKEQLDVIKDRCRRADVVLKKAQIRIERIDLD